MTASPVRVVTAAMVLMMTSWLVSGRPRQARVIWENSRCSILFHLEVPGGKWQQVISSPVSCASCASPAFQARFRQPLDPPASQVTSSRAACRVGVPAGQVPPAADRLHRERGGVVVGAHVHEPGVRGHVVDPVRDRVPALLIGEAVVADPHRVALRPPFPPRLRVLPDLLFLLGVHADHRLPGRQVLPRLRGDIPELGVPVRVPPPLGDLRVGLRGEPLLVQQPPRGLRAAPVPLPRSAHRPGASRSWSSTPAATPDPPGWSPPPAPAAPAPAPDQSRPASCGPRPAGGPAPPAPPAPTPAPPPRPRPSATTPRSPSPPRRSRRPRPPAPPPPAPAAATFSSSTGSSSSSSGPISPSSSAFAPIPASWHATRRKLRLFRNVYIGPPDRPQNPVQPRKTNPTRRSLKVLMVMVLTGLRRP